MSWTPSLNTPDSELTTKRELVIDVGSGEEPAPNGEPARLLQTVSEAS